MSLKLDGTKFEFSLDGTINKINQVVFRIDATETWLDVVCPETQVHKAEKTIKAVRKEFDMNISPFNTLLAPKNDTDRELRFLGMLHLEVAGKPFEFEASFKGAYEPGQSKRVVYVEHRLQVPILDVRYLSDYIIRRPER